jgi:hypothetical protein
MISKMARSWWLLLVGALTMPAVAGQHVYMFHYSNFYNQLKHNNEKNHPDIRVGLFFIQQSSRNACHVSEARLEHKKHNEMLNVYPTTGEVELPIDSNLRQLNPLIYITSLSDEPCDISMMVLAKKPMSGVISITELVELSDQMQTLLTQLSGTIGKWFTPKVTGIRIEFSTFENGLLTTSSGEEIEVVDFKANITASNYLADDTIMLPEATKYITPIISSAAPQ